MTDSERNEDWVNDADAALPEADEMCIPFGWRIILMPKKQPRKTTGGIIIPDQVGEKEEWLNYVAQIVAVGPLAYRHRKYKEMGLTEADQPKRGQWWLYSPYAPYRMSFKGQKFIALDDDSLIARVPDGVSPWEFRAGV